MDGGGSSTSWYFYPPSSTPQILLGFKAFGKAELLRRKLLPTTSPVADSSAAAAAVSVATSATASATAGDCESVSFAPVRFCNENIDTLNSLAKARATSTNVVEMAANTNHKDSGERLFTIATLKGAIAHHLATHVMVYATPKTIGENKSDLAQELSNLRRELFQANPAKKGELINASKIVINTLTLTLTSSL